MIWNKIKNKFLHNQTFSKSQPSCCKTMTMSNDTLLHMFGYLLPIPYLMRCKTVCKQWNHLVFDFSQTLTSLYLIPPPNRAQIVAEPRQEFLNFLFEQFPNIDILYAPCIFLKQHDLAYCIMNTWKLKRVHMFPCSRDGAMFYEPMEMATRMVEQVFLYGTEEFDELPQRVAFVYSMRDHENDTKFLHGLNYFSSM